MITVEKSRRIFQLVSQLNTAASALVAGAQPRTVCAWCSPTLEQPSAPVSHGICGPCTERFERGGAR
jgi:hypothetical protein